MIDKYINELTPRLDKSVEHLEEGLSTIHTGRASTTLVDQVMVDAYGSKQAIKQIANISIPEPRQILIQPWDKALTAVIESALRQSDLGFNPVNAGDVIRINIPELTAERRQEFVKIARERAEEARVSIRNARQEAWNQVKKAKTDGNISEDEMYRGESEIQKVIDKYNKIVEEILQIKEKELLEI